MLCPVIDAGVMLRVLPPSTPTIPESSPLSSNLCVQFLGTQGSLSRNVVVNITQVQNNEYARPSKLRTSYKSELQWNPKIRTLLGPGKSVLMREVS